MPLNPFTAVTSKIYAGLFGAALALVAVQTVRIEGLWSIHGLEDQLAGARSALAMEKAGRAADLEDWRRQVAAAQAAKRAAELTSKEIATDAQASHDALLADNAGLREYIAAHRLPAARARADAGAPAGAAGDHGTRVPAPASAGAVVAASEADLVACDTDYGYAAAAHEWAQRLITGGLGK